MFNQSVQEIHVPGVAALSENYFRLIYRYNVLVYDITKHNVRETGELRKVSFVFPEFRTALH